MDEVRRAYGVMAEQYKVVTAYHWPADQLAARLRRAGFTEVERQRRPGIGARTPPARRHRRGRELS